jgi:DNA-binding MarR family transcriptional regulator
MSKLDFMKDRKFVFGSVLITANRIDTLLDRNLKEFEVTAKQWFLTVVIDNSFDSPPTIKELAKQMGSSHQNVKQMALKLEQKGLLILEKDKKDARVTRLRLTEESYKFWKATEAKASVFTSVLFKGIEENEMAMARKVLSKMMDNLSEMDHYEAD